MGVSHLHADSEPAAPASGSTIASGTTTNSTYAGWNVLDSVGVIASNSTQDTGTDVSYGATTFVNTANTRVSTLTGTNTVDVSFNADYVGRVDGSTSEAASSWVASVPTGSGGSLTLGTGSAVSNTAFAGRPLTGTLGGPNVFTTTVTFNTNDVNDGGITQRSQVFQVEVNFSSPVTISNLDTAFDISATASGAALPIIGGFFDQAGNFYAAGAGASAQV